VVVFHRKHDDSDAADDTEDGSPVKRGRACQSSKHCHMCNCRLELAVREVGKCKCGTFTEPKSQ